MPRRTDIQSILIIGAGPKLPSPRGGRGRRASARRVRGRGQDLLNGRPDAVEILKHIVVPQAKDTETLAFEKGRPPSVLFGSMLPAVDFDDEPPFGAKKVRDITIDLDLPPEPEAINLTVAKDAPELLLRVRGVSAQTTRPARQEEVPCHHAPSPDPFGATLSRVGERGSCVDA